MSAVAYWPRVGYALLPAVYRGAWFDEALPSAVVNKVGLPPGTTFADLDSSVWGRVRQPEVLRLVANHVLAIVTRRLYFGSDPRAAKLAILGYELPTDVTLESLPFSNRTLNTLKRAGRLGDLEWVSRVCATEFLSLPGAGARTLLDFATVVEEHYSGNSDESVKARSAPLIVAVARTCDQIRSQFPISRISLHDPRIKSTRASFSLDETLASWKASAQVSSVEELEHTLRTLLQLREELRRIVGQRLDEALNDLLSHVASSKYATALAARLGWDGQGGRTLEEVAKACGVTRERIRQVERAALNKISQGTFLPALDAAIALMGDAAAAFEPDVTNILLAAGLVSRTFKPHGILTAAKALGRAVDFDVSDDGLTVHKIGDDHFVPIREAFKTLANVNYVASVSELQARIQELGFASISEDSTRHLLASHPRTVWLDSDRRWFWLQQKEGRNRYVNAARKVLSVAGRVRIDILRDGALRHYRSKGMSLPRGAFEGLCRAAGFEIEDGFVSSPDVLDPRDTLAPIESVFVEVLRRKENVLGLHELRDGCVKAGVNRHSFYVYLSYSPIITRVAPSIWALRGTDFDPTRVSRLLQHSTPKKPTLQGNGWTPDGAIWIAYEVSRAVLDTGVVTIPSGVHEILGDGRFELYAVDGARVGTLSMRKLSAWGLGSFIGRRGVEIGDHLIVAVDIELQMAVIHTGSVDVLESFEEGEGWGPRRLLSGVPTSLSDLDE